MVVLPSKKKNIACSHPIFHFQSSSFKEAFCFSSECTIRGKQSKVTNKMWGIIKQAERQTRKNGEEAMLVWTAPSSHAQTYSGGKYLFYHAAPGLSYTPSPCNNVIATPEIIAVQAREWQMCHREQAKDTCIAFYISRMCWSYACCLQLQSPLL